MFGSGLVYLAGHHELFCAAGTRTSRRANWHIEARPLQGHDGWTIVALSVLFFPKLALGLSGFETGVAVMPLIEGDPQRYARTPARPHSQHAQAAGRRGRHHVGVLARLVDCDGHADSSGRLGRRPDRAARPIGRWPTWPTAKARSTINPLFGEVFGTIYDVSTIVILSFAGLSAMAGLLNLVPQYLPRYGMAPEWSRAVRPLVVLFTAINLLVTWIFDADVDGPGRRLRHRRAGADLAAPAWPR